MAVDRKILNSWKEIAAYMGRGVRTVQRWERDFHLPVHRPSGHDRSAVIAFADEVDQWLASTPIKDGKQHLARSLHLSPRTHQLAEIVESTARTLFHSAEKLQSNVLRVQEQQQRRERARKQQPA